LKRSNRLVLLVGVFLAVIAFVGIVLIIPKGQTVPPEGLPPEVLPAVIATKDIPLGAVVTADMLTTQDLRIDTQRKATAFSDPIQVVGNIARRKIVTGTQLQTEFFDTSTTGCGVIDVPPGLRAIAVQVDQVSGVGTVINSGDYVDAVVGFTGDKFPVVTVNPQDDSITVVAGLNGTSVKLLIEGMQVLCRQLPPVAPPANGGAEPAPSDGGTVSLNGQQEIVMLGVTASQAEVIKFSQLDGSITLALRSRNDFVDEAGNPIPAPPSATEGITLKTLTEDFAVPIPELVEAILPTQANR
jgi:pilus assembly protein CpaB